MAKSDKKKRVLLGDVVEFRRNARVLRGVAVFKAERHDGDVFADEGYLVSEHGIQWADDGEARLFWSIPQQVSRVPRRWLVRVTHVDDEPFRPLAWECVGGPRLSVFDDRHVERRASERAKTAAA